MLELPPRSHFRDSAHYLLAATSEIAAPLLRVGARLVTGSPTPVSTWRTALIVGHGHIGDVLCQTVALGTLRRALPRCELDYLTMPLAAEVLAGNPHLRSILPFNTDARPDALTASGLRRLRDTQYDAILCTNTVRHQEGLRLALTLRIPNRVAFTHRGLSGLATIPVRLTQPTAPAVQSRAMVRAITGVASEAALRPEIFPAASDRVAADRELQRLGLTRNDPVLACSITTRQEVGRVHPAFFTRILAHVQETAPDVRVVLCGSASDASALESVRRDLDSDVRVAAGSMSILAYGAFLARCTAFLGMDSGPRHLANAAGIPVFFVRNLAVRAAEAGAYCPTETDIAPPGDYLSPEHIGRTLDSVDPARIAAQIVECIRQRDNGRLSTDR